MREMTLLLETLAAKLGATVELLWSVLLKQAPISATVSLLTVSEDIMSKGSSRPAGLTKGVESCD